MSHEPHLSDNEPENLQTRKSHLKIPPGGFLQSGSVNLGSSGISDMFYLRLIIKYQYFIAFMFLIVLSLSLFSIGFHSIFIMDLGSMSSLDHRVSYIYTWHLT